MTTLEVLEGTRKLIENEENWCQKHYAISAKGNPVRSQSKRACKFCLDGALERATGSKSPYLEARALLGGVIYFNDTHTHPEVLALLDRAIEAERGKQ